MVRQVLKRGQGDQRHADIGALEHAVDPDRVLLHVAGIVADVHIVAAYRDAGVGCVACARKVRKVHEAVRLDEEERRPLAGEETTLLHVARREARLVAPDGVDAVVVAEEARTVEARDVALGVCPPLVGWLGDGDQR